MEIDSGISSKVNSNRVGGISSSLTKISSDLSDGTISSSSRVAGVKSSSRVGVIGISKTLVTKAIRTGKTGNSDLIISREIDSTSKRVMGLHLIATLEKTNVNISSYLQTLILEVLAITVNLSSNLHLIANLVHSIVVVGAVGTIATDLILSSNVTLTVMVEVLAVVQTLIFGSSSLRLMAIKKRIETALILPSSTAHLIVMVLETTKLLNNISPLLIAMRMTVRTDPTLISSTVPLIVVAETETICSSRNVRLINTNLRADLMSSPAHLTMTATILALHRSIITNNVVLIVVTKVRLVMVLILTCHLQQIDERWMTLLKETLIICQHVIRTTEEMSA